MAFHAIIVAPPPPPSCCNHRLIMYVQVMASRLGDVVGADEMATFGLSNGVIFTLAPIKNDENNEFFLKFFL